MKRRVLSVLLALALCLSLVPMAAMAADPSEDISEDISYELTDSYGDGWNGCAIQITDTTENQEVASLTIENGSSATGTVELAYGHTYRFTWVSGSYSNECDFTIWDENGDVILSGNGNDASSIFPVDFTPTAPVEIDENATLRILLSTAVCKEFL